MEVQAFDIHVNQALVSRDVSSAIEFELLLTLIRKVTALQMTSCHGTSNIYPNQLLTIMLRLSHFPILSLPLLH